LAFAQNSTIKFEKAEKVDRELLKEHKRFQNVKLPIFSLQDTAGNLVKLDSIKGKTIILHFWYTSCQPCIVDMPYFKKVVDFYKDSSTVQIISICVDRGINKKAWKQLITTFELQDCHVLLDRDKIIPKQHQFYRNIPGFPTYMVIDSTYKSLGCLINVDLIAGFIYEIERARQGIATNVAFMEVINVNKQFVDWLNRKGKIFLDL
jgi:peroxiredoxin